MSFFNRIFLPKQNIFFELLKDLAKFQVEIAFLLREFAKEFKDFSTFSQKAREIEHRADLKTHELVDKINKTFVTPIDREDLYLLAHELDELVDQIENVIHNIELYEVHTKHPALEQFTEIIVQASKDLEELIDHFQEQKQSAYLLQLKVKIHGLEDQGDLFYKEAIHDLFQNEKDPINLIKWKDILENLEKIMDQYQHVSDTIEGVIVKSS